MRARSLSPLWIPLLTLGAGCSLINSFDEVKPLAAPVGSSGAAGAAGAAAGSAGTGGSESGSGGGGSSAGSAGSGASTAGSGGATAGSGGATAGSGGATAGSGGATAGAGGGPLTGAAVMSGLVPGTPDQRILTVLDMSTGAETTREQLVVSGIVHDPFSDTFFVFESSTEPDPAPGDAVTLRARKLDMSTGKWLPDLGSVSVPANVRGSAVALHDRVAFLTYPGGAGTKRGVVIVDTKDPAAMKVLPDTGMTLGAAETTAVIASPDATSTGGILGLAGITACNVTMKSCEASIQPVSVTDSGVTFLARKSIGTYEYTVGASMAFGAGNDQFIAAFPPASPAKGYVQRYTTTSLSKAGAPTPFDASGPALKALAYDACDDISFVSELTDQAIFVVPTDPAKPPALQSLGKPGQRVAFDHATRTVIVPYSLASQHFIRAFKLDPTKPAKPLTERIADWKPPTDFEPDQTAVRNANPLCP